MIEEYERLLADGCRDPEATRQHLLRKAEEDRQERVAQIEADFKICELIRFGLTLPRESPAFGIAKGTCNWFRKKYPPDDTLAREIRKSTWAIDHDLNERRKDDEDTGKQTTDSGCGDD